MMLLPAEDAVLLRLNRHLEILSQGFGLPNPMAQLPLFPALPIRASTSTLKGVLS
jgi:hypothetical protein